MQIAAGSVQIEARIQAQVERAELGILPARLMRLERSLHSASEEQGPADHWRTVRNPVIGDEVTFVQTARETGGDHTLARVVLKPGGGNPLHYHLTYEIGRAHV